MDVQYDYYSLLYRYVFSQKFKDDFLLCHYTSINVLKKILQRDKIDFRLTESTCMMDYSEGQEIDRCYKNVLEVLKTSNIDQDFLTLLENVRLEDQNSTEFVACFSSDLDSLPMWNYYGKKDDDSGICIEFNPSLLNMANLIIENPDITSYQNIHSSNAVVVAPVFYTEEQKVNILEHIILDIYGSFYQKYRSSESSNLNSIISHLFQVVVKNYRLLFKNKKFNFENEYRIIMSIQNDDLTKLKIEEGESNGIKKRYLHLTFTRDTSREKIRAITIAPPQSPNVTNDILTYLEQNNFKHVEIKQSKIPIRF